MRAIVKQEVLHDDRFKDQYIWLRAGQAPIQLVWNEATGSFD